MDLLQQQLTLQAYLDWENIQPERHEFHRAEVFRINADGLFVLLDMSESEMLELHSIGCRVAIAEVFAGIDIS